MQCNMKVPFLDVISHSVLWLYMMTNPESQLFSIRVFLIFLQSPGMLVNHLLRATTTSYGKKKSLRKPSGTFTL